MTREEAIEIIKNRDFCCIECIERNEECCKALDMAIKALSAISELSKSLKAVNRYEMDEKVLIGFNMAVAMFNECFGEIEQNVGMCQQNEEKTAEWIFYIADNDGNDGNEEKWCKCSKCGYKEFYLPPKRNVCPNCGRKMKGV